MIVALASAFAGPSVAVTFDNGGFNLPLYTGRWNGQFAQPSVAQQLAADIARLQPGLRVFSYLPPGTLAGRSSDPFEVLPTLPGCATPDQPVPAGDSCACPPGDRCWTGLDASRDPAASTSLFQATAAVRARVTGPRVEVHVTDLFEEDPSLAENPADADRCVTREGTRKALEALFSPQDGPLTHVAVGVLTARIDPPRVAAGGLTVFAAGEGDCWTADRLRTFGPGQAAEVAMAVVVLGVGTDGFDAEVRAFVEGLERQVSAPLSLDLVMVREPAVTLLAPPATLAAGASMALPALPDRATPCAALIPDASFTAGPARVGASVTPGGTCGSAGMLVLAPGDVRGAWRRQAGLNPTVGGVSLAGSVTFAGDAGSVQSAVAGLAARHPVADRPLVFWDALVDALRIGDPRGVGRARQITVNVPSVRIERLDDRPWMLAAGLGLALSLGVLALVHAVLVRVMAERAFRRHLGRAKEGRPIAAVLAEANEAARAGWVGRFVVAAGAGAVCGVCAFVVVLLAHGVRGG